MGEVEDESEKSHDSSAVDVDVEANNNAVADDGFKSPFDLPTSRKWLMTFFMSAMTFVATLGSSIFSSTIPVTTQQFNVSETVMILGVSLYVLGRLKPCSN